MQKMTIVLLSKTTEMFSVISSDLKLRSTD